MQSPRSLQTVREYHEATKHTVEKLYTSRHGLDWANMPDPFRHYEQAEVLDLPADVRTPSTPALSLLRGGMGDTRCADGAEFLSTLLFHTAAISATKRAGSGMRYALRVNPSSGNLHPTEFHFAARNLKGWTDGLYHYRVSAHMAEQRGRGGDWVREAADLAVAPWFRECGLFFALTSIAWREAWKYRDRAYRYCLHDIGHAWGALDLAARALGCETQAFPHFADKRVAEWLGVEDEWPMLLIGVRGDGLPLERRDAAERQWVGGVANELSKEMVPYPAIAEVHTATSEEMAVAHVHSSVAPNGSGEVELSGRVDSAEAFAAVVRRRRSALDFKGAAATISREQLGTLLEVAAEVSNYVQLYVYLHRVRGLEPGVYCYWKSSGTLEVMEYGDQRLMAAGLSLGQDLAANSCVTFSMIADMDRAMTDHGARGYRMVFIEAGHIGQRLYVGAESLGFQSTGIGAFYDDQVHRYLKIKEGEGQVVYHFACGYAVHDGRLEG